MRGYYEARAQGPAREQFRLFCILENAEPEELRRRGLNGPAIAVITGLRKRWMTTFAAVAQSCAALACRARVKLLVCAPTPLSSADGQQCYWPGAGAAIQPHHHEGDGGA